MTDEVPAVILGPEGPPHKLVAPPETIWLTAGVPNRFKGLEIANALAGTLMGINTFGPGDSIGISASFKALEAFMSERQIGTVFLIVAASQWLAMLSVKYPETRFFAWLHWTPPEDEAMTWADRLAGRVRLAVVPALDRIALACGGVRCRIAGLGAGVVFWFSLWGITMNDAVGWCIPAPALEHLALAITSAICLGDLRQRARS
jgi:hypothetical protein